MRRGDHHFPFRDGFGDLQAPFFPKRRLALSLVGEILLQGAPQRLQAGFDDLGHVLVPAQVEALLRPLTASGELPPQVTSVLSSEVKGRHRSLHFHG